MSMQPTRYEHEWEELRDELGRERVRRFGVIQSRTSSHTTACSIWGDDGQGHAEGFSGPLPCNCGALLNWEREKNRALTEENARLREDAQLYVDQREMTLAAKREVEARYVTERESRERGHD